MNGYNLIRDWYNFKFTNPSKAKAIHSDMYCYLVDLWNRLGQKSEFGLPTTVTMEVLGIGSYNTYKKTLNDLIQFGFIKVISESKNQHQSKIIALSKNDKATDKALDEATIKATNKPTDTIYKQENNRTIDVRKNDFAKSLQPYLDIYGKDMLNEFFLYWTEPNQKKTKMKYELERTWSFDRRLNTWSKQSVKFGTAISKQEKTKFNPYG